MFVCKNKFQKETKRTLKKQIKIKGQVGIERYY